MKKVSIIVPTYNSENYIKKCLDSIIAQTYCNLEIIIVDDGSFDSTKDIIDTYRKDERIRIIYAKHFGPGNARNIGIDASTGDYISFIDSDDTIDEKFIEELVTIISPIDSFAQCAGKFIFSNNTSFDSFLANEEDIKCFKIPILCNKLFNKKMINKYKIRFKNLYYGEDIDFWGRLLLCNDNISVSQNKYYYYHYRDNSLTHSYKNKEDIFKIFLILDDMLALSKENNKYIEYEKRLEFLFVKEVLIRAIKQLSYFEDFSEKDIKKMQNYVENNFPDWKNNKYIKTIFNESRKKRLKLIESGKYEDLIMFLKNTNMGCNNDK